MMVPVDLPSTRTLTFLFTDLEDSTRLWERFPEAMKDALYRHDAILRTAIESSTGRVVKTTGDGMMAVFGNASDATGAALAAQLSVAAEPWATPVRCGCGWACIAVRPSIVAARP